MVFASPSNMLKQVYQNAISVFYVLEYALYPGKYHMNVNKAQLQLIKIMRIAVGSSSTRKRQYQMLAKMG